MKLELELPEVVTSGVTYALGLIGDEEELQVNVREEGMTTARVRIEIRDGCVKLHVWNRGNLIKDSPDRTISLAPVLGQEEWESESEEDEELPYPPPPPSHCYLGFLPCGCLTAVSSFWEVWPVLNDAEAAAQFVRSGLTVKFVTFDEYKASGLRPLGCQCQASADTLAMKQITISTGLLQELVGIAEEALGAEEEISLSRPTREVVDNARAALGLEPRPQGWYQSDQAV